MKHDLALLFFRLTFGCTLAFAHGLPKIEDFANLSSTFADPLGVGPFVSLSLVVFAEFFCALCVAIGFATRFAAITVLINMVVILGMVHLDDPFAKKEMPLLFAAAFAFFVFEGGGRFSFDHLLQKAGLIKSKRLTTTRAY